MHLGDKAHASLVLTLTMMEAQVVEGGSFTIPLSTAKINAEREVTDPATSKKLTSLWHGLMDAIARKKGGEASNFVQRHQKIILKSMI